MVIEIKHRFTGEVICTGETIADAVAKNLRILYGANLRGANLRGADLGGADLGGANLYGADLRGADLRGADLGGADLGGADLYGADLRGADLHGADLHGANLRGANLYGADLTKAKLAWQSHDLLAEILRRAAGDDLAKLKVAGLVLICRDKCWSEFIRMDDPLTGWALGELAKCVQDGDDAPECFRQAKVVAL